MQTNSHIHRWIRRSHRKSNKNRDSLFGKSCYWIRHPVYVAWSIKRPSQIIPCRVYYLTHRREKIFIELITTNYGFIYDHCRLQIHYRPVQRCGSPSLFISKFQPYIDIDNINNAPTYHPHIKKLTKIISPISKIINSMQFVIFVEYTYYLL